MTAFATADDVSNLKRSLTVDEREMAENLLPVVSDMLRYEAEKRGKNLDQMVSQSAVFANVLKSVTVDVTFRELTENAAQAAHGINPAMSQMSQSALGYSISGTFANAGGGLFIKRSELQRLGLTRQKFGFLDLYGVSEG